MEESHDEELDRADFAQNCPKGHTDRAHAEVRIDEAVGRQVQVDAERKWVLRKLRLSMLRL